MGLFGGLVLGGLVLGGFLFCGCVRWLKVGLGC